MKLESAQMEISLKNNQFEHLKESQASSIDVDKLKEQIEEERSKFAQIMTSWAQEVKEFLTSPKY